MNDHKTQMPKVEPWMERFANIILKRIPPGHIDVPRRYIRVEEDSIDSARRYIIQTIAHHAAPELIPWVSGDFAQWTGRDGASGLVKILYSNKPLYVVRPVDEDISFSAHTNKLSIPTRSQLATEIGTDEDGKPILAWACEIKPPRGTTGRVITTVSTQNTNEYAFRHIVERAGIPIITASQRERHYPDGYPPEE